MSVRSRVVVPHLEQHKSTGTVHTRPRHTGTRSNTRRRLPAFAQLSLCEMLRCHVTARAQHRVKSLEHWHIVVHSRTVQHRRKLTESRKMGGREEIKKNRPQWLHSWLVWPDVVPIPRIVVWIGVVWHHRIPRIPIGDLNFHRLHSGISPPPIYTSLKSPHRGAERPCGALELIVGMKSGKLPARAG